MKDCEQKLALDDITSEDNFAELPPSEVDAAYLKGMGISAKGVQQKIIKLHRELYELKLLSPTSTAKPVGGNNFCVCTFYQRINLLTTYVPNWYFKSQQWS